MSCFQFLPRTAKETGKYLSALRDLMQDTSLTGGGIQAYVVPSGDAHQVCTLV